MILPASRALVAMVGAVLTVCAGCGDAAAPLRGSKTWASHPQHFVVVFRSNSSEHRRHQHMRLHAALAETDSESEIRHNFTFASGLHGYAARFSDKLLRSALEDDDVVEYIEFDGIVKATAPLHGSGVNASSTSGIVGEPAKVASCATQGSAPWGLTRIAQRNKNLNGQYTYGTDGANVKVYVLDTGISVNHEDFGGRATWGATFATNSDGSKTDRNGHGTHCAGTIGGSTYGVAKQASLVAVQVLTDTGSGTMSGVIKGLEWVCQNKNKNGNQCVINLSLSGGYYSAMNDAANSAHKCGCVVVVAAGNDGSDACQRSPASASEVISVGASSNNDKRAYFSNKGGCVDIFAPGVYIKSTWIGSNYAVNTISGTSMAAPHVAGAAAKLLGSTGYDPDTAKSSILASATSGYLSDVGSNSPNKLLYSNTCE